MTSQSLLPTDRLRWISFQTDEVERNRWIDAVPNEHSSLLKLKKIFACERHFDCEWVSAKGGGEKDQANHHPSFLVYKSLA